jgi:hypothetical protein
MFVLQRWRPDRRRHHPRDWPVAIDLGMANAFTLSGYLFAALYSRFAIHVSRVPRLSRFA